MSRLHIFDMDGTLLRGASVEEVSRRLGCFDEANSLEQAYARGEISDAASWWDQIFRLWESASDAELERAFEESEWMEGIHEVFEDITERGERSVVMSQSPHFLVRRLEHWGAHATYATSIERGVPCRNDQMLTAEHKVEIATTIMADLGLSPMECVAYGDSTSDERLFRHLPFSVGINAAPAIRELATRTYDGNDLREAYRIGRALVDDPNRHITADSHRRRSQIREREITT
ncbi:unannotated protein [freshwater metagenome]|uniref:phosphoserine phosphatase n=1 Tax=freshwater metagenome TaxID=449393 RepID=A0A6J7DP56_9ZZZZ|nr:HAD-IB family phosphatase [Actinomycetota bacterium]